MAEHFYPQIAEFDQLLKLAKEAPEQLDLLQQHLNETCIAGASTERSAWKLRRLLMQVGEIKKSTSIHNWCASNFSCYCSRCCLMHRRQTRH